MLKVHIDAHAERPVCSINVDGNLSTILADITMVINDIYNTMRMHDPDCAEAYKDSLTRAFLEANHLVFVRTDMRDCKVEAMSYEVPD